MLLVGSSGGHLAACALTTDWQREFGLPADTLKGGLCCNGSFLDLLATADYGGANTCKDTEEGHGVGKCDGMDCAP